MFERDEEKIFEAFRNCITEPKCKNCPWGICDLSKNGHIEIPKDLAISVIRMLGEKIRGVEYDGD